MTGHSGKTTIFFINGLIRPKAINSVNVIFCKNKNPCPFPPWAAVQPFHFSCIQTGTLQISSSFDSLPLHHRCLPLCMCLNVEKKIQEELHSNEWLNLINHINHSHKGTSGTRLFNSVKIIQRRSELLLWQQDTFNIIFLFWQDYKMEGGRNQQTVMSSLKSQKNLKNTCTALHSKQL